jgi:acyl dehydratase
MYFEAFKVGDVFTSRGRTITEAEGSQFVNAAWYINPRCTDAEFAKKGYIWNGIELHERIVPPPTGTFLASGLARSIGVLNETQMAVLKATWRAPAVVVFGDTIQLRMTVTESRDSSRPDAGILVFDMHIINQRGEIVNDDQLTFLVARNSGANGRGPAMPFFATMDDQNEHWECYQRVDTAQRPQAQMSSHYFEDFKTGDAFDTRWRTVDATDVSNFIALTWDHHPLYTDALFARSTGFGDRIAPPLLGIAYAVGLDAPLAMGAGTCLGFTHTDWQFVGPIKVGDTLQLRQTIGATSVRDDETGIVPIEMKIVNESGGVSITGTRDMLVRRRPMGNEINDKLMAWH